MIEPSPMPNVRYDSSRAALLIHNLALDDVAVVSECRHWTNGRRGEVADLDTLSNSDLSAFATQALAIGAQAITSAGGVQETYDIRGLMSELEERSAQAATEAARRTSEAVTQASIAMEQASTSAKRSVTEAGEAVRKSFSANVDAARKALADELNRLVGGDQPELLVRLQPLLEDFGRNLQTQSAEQTSKLINKVVGQFDPTEPTSPMSQQIRVLSEQQGRYAEAMATEHRALTVKVEELARGLAAKKATEIAISRTTRKGGAYEDQVHGLMATIAAGLGDEYLNTGGVTGLKTRSKKGDGVLAVCGSETRVVLEMTDSPRTHWTSYLSEAEQNRGAHASLGLVRTAECLGGNTMLTLGPRRIVMAFDPEADDAQLLRSVVQLLRLAAEAAATRVDSGEITTADERLAEALAALERLVKIQKTAGQIRSNANSIDSEAGALQADLARLLTQARTALAGVSEEAHGHAA